MRRCETWSRVQEADYSFWRRVDESENSAVGETTFGRCNAMLQHRSKRKPLDGKKMTSNRIQEESNVAVAVRVRPLNKAERERKEESVILCPDKHNLQVSQEGSQDRCFSFDAVLGPDSTQEDVFEACQVERLVDMATQGYSCTVLAFGQTGSGKTFTITGPHMEFQEGAPGPTSHGLMQRCLSRLLEACPTGGGVTLQASYLEIYNEQVRDLLDPWPRRPLSIRGGGASGFCVGNLTPVEFRTLDDFNQLLEEGQRRRHTSSHLLNKWSSRGHAILTVYIGSQSQVGVEGSGASRGKLSLVDLAGSERVKVTGSEAELLEEAGNINRSLLTLGKCISALVDARGRARHIPYRESKLTKLLCDSLGGIACVSPTASSLPETLNTLYYSSQARGIRPRPPANQGRREKLVSGLQREIRLLHKENLLLRQRLSSFQEAQRSELEANHAGSGCGEAATVEGVGHSRPGSTSSSLEACLLQELNQEKDKIEQDKVELPDCQEHSSQQRELLPEENTQRSEELQDPEREQIFVDGVQGKGRSGISSPLTPPPPRDPAHNCLSCPYCLPHHPHPRTLVPPVGSAGLLEPHFHCHWHPLLYCMCPASCSLQGLGPRCTLPPLWPYQPFPHLWDSCVTKRHRQVTLPPLPGLGSGRAARESAWVRRERHSWEADPGSVRVRGTRRYTDGSWVNSSSQQAKSLEPHPPRSEGRVAPSAPPLPKQPHPFQPLDPGR